MHYFDEVEIARKKLPPEESIEVYNNEQTSALEIKRNNNDFSLEEFEKDFRAK